MTPWWIITMLADDAETNGFNQQSFAALLDQQLLDWSLASGVMQSPEKPRWWHVEALPPPPAGQAVEPSSQADALIARLEDCISDPLELRPGEAAQRISGRINAGQLMIALVGDARSEATRTHLHCLGRLLKLKRSSDFGGRTVKQTALIYLPKASNTRHDRGEIAKFLCELNTMMQAREYDARPFQSVNFFQDTNVSGDNPRGYAALTESNLTELAAQSLLHLMIGGEDSFSRARQADDAAYYSLGAGAIYYDWRGHQRRLAAQAGSVLLARFKEADKAPFVDAPAAEAVVRDVKKFLDVSHLFKQFALAPGRPSFVFEPRIWAPAKDRHGRTISPWALFSTALLNIYFRVYLRWLPFRLSEYARVFLTLRLQEFRDYLRRRSDVLWSGSGAETGLEPLIRQAQQNALKGEFGGGRSLEQLRLVLRRIQDACNLDRLDSELNAREDFAKLEVFAIPQEIREFYDHAEETLEIEREFRLYDELVEQIKRHPLPLALFARAALVAVAFAFLGERLLDFLSPNILNVEWVLQVPGLAPGLLFLLPLFLAFWHYRVRTLNKLKRIMRGYVGAILRHAQTLAKEEIKSEMRRLGHRAQEYCEQLLLNLDRLKTELHYPPPGNEAYRSTTFHRSLLEMLAIPGRGNPVTILNGASPDYQIRVDGRQIHFRDTTAEQQRSLLDKLLDQPVARADRRLWQLLEEMVANSASPQPLAGATATICDFVESLYADVRDRKLVWWLQREAAAHLTETLDRLRRLASPPASFHQGAVLPRPAHFVWKYSDLNSLRSLLKNATEEQEATADGGLLALSAAQAFVELRSLSCVNAMSSLADARAAERRAQDPTRLFVLATTKLENAGDLTLVSAIDGARFIAEGVSAAEVDKVRRRLGLAAGERAPIRI